MLPRVALVRIDALNERIASIISVTTTSELGTTSAAFLGGMLRLLVTANVVCSSLILVTLMMEVTRSPEMLALTRAMRHNIREDGILYISFRLLI
jgi:hypothetical protein